MKRRKFISATGVTGALAASYPISAMSNFSAANQGITEVRRYELAFRGNRGILVKYLNEVLKPALTGIGANQLMIFEEQGKSEPSVLWVIIGYPDPASYLDSLTLLNDAGFIKKSSEYNAVAPGQPIYSRISSMLLHGFSAYPNVVSPQTDSKLFELRIYEGFSEDAVRRKIKMFNTEEIDLFLKLNMHPVFFGNMVVGPYCPSLVYMLDFKDMGTRNKIWGEFVAHPDWKAMSGKKEYADSISNIRKIFLEKI